MSSLSTFEKHWDQSRASLGARYFYEDEDILIATDFECGSGEEILKSGDDAFRMRSETEPGWDHMFRGKSTYFCVGIHNKLSRSRRITLTITNFTHDLDQVRYIVVREGSDDWGHLPLEDVRPDTETKLLNLYVDLPPFDGLDSAIFLCNFHWHAYTDMMAATEQVADKHPFVSLQILGKTHQGREIIAVNFGDGVAGKPKIVVAQTPQPSESGHWSCKSVIDFLASDEPDARMIRERTCVSVIPHTNPDGTVLGHAMTNALGQAPFFDAYPASEGREASVESTVMWNFIEDLRPWLFIEFHSAFQDYRQSHAILKYDSSLSEDEDASKLFGACDEVLEAMPENFTESVTYKEEGYTTSLGYAVAIRLNVVPYMYKLHDKYPLKDNLRHAVKVFKALEGVRHRV